MRNIEDDRSRARGKAIRHCAAQSLACIAGAITTRDNERHHAVIFE